MQNVNFKNIDEFYDFLPQDELEITLALQRIIEQTLPDFSMHLAYNTLFFKRNTNFCFIWPSSILWGKNKTYEGVRLGFTKGDLISDASFYLEKGNRKQVYWKDIEYFEDIDQNAIKDLLIQSYDIS